MENVKWTPRWLGSESEKRRDDSPYWEASSSLLSVFVREDEVVSAIHSHLYHEVVKHNTIAILAKLEPLKLVSADKGGSIT